MQIRPFLSSFLVSLLVAGAASAHAHGYTAGSIRIEHPWARATAPGQPSGGGFLKLTNAGEADKLIAVRADVSASTELHTMQMEGDIMRMRQVDAIAVPAGGEVELKPGGYHIMFVRLKAPLKEGASFPATLVFEKAGEVQVEFKVHAPGARGGEHGTHGMHH
ncbi:copper chaperone PCu(A)C [Pigmentiphaga sp.]|uniref:copper chaperone PCu(A)C n=1 Tax=Pigmentiphaga sp. TaxID=1977564 RepID=UPI0025FB52C1|nr:copper chaperone PCu(A)C [Pigmentiphaga sp.]MBX6318403.1 copper chaperone PCu(A)C [Pigmentiphaga sp.]